MHPADGEVRSFHIRRCPAVNGCFGQEPEAIIAAIHILIGPPRAAIQGDLLFNIGSTELRLSVTANAGPSRSYAGLKQHSSL